MQIKNKELPLPIIQGGMGVGISLSGLAGAVAACGGMGVISAAHPGYLDPDFDTDMLAVNLRCLQEEIEKAKKTAAGRGLVGVNIMVAAQKYEQFVWAAVQAGADAIISGAGLPTELPAIAGDADILLAPIVSSGRAAKLLCRKWERAGRLPDFVVIEGSRAGGHLGFSPEELESKTAPELWKILAEVLDELRPFEEKCGCPIPVFVAGGIFTGAEIAQAQQRGAAGVQMATRFIATEECDADIRYKQAMVNAREEDVVLIKSPVGMPGRALNSPLIQRIAIQGRIPPQHCLNCLRPCNPAETSYCITDALIAAAKGDWENGLFFCGDNVGRVDKIVPVRELIEELVHDWRANQ